MSVSNLLYEMAGQLFINNARNGTLTEEEAHFFENPAIATLVELHAILEAADPFKGYGKGDIKFFQELIFDNGVSRADFGDEAGIDNAREAREIFDAIAGGHAGGEDEEEEDDDGDGDGEEDDEEIVAPRARGRSARLRSLDLYLSKHEKPESAVAKVLGAVYKVGGEAALAGIGGVLKAAGWTIPSFIGKLLYGAAKGALVGAWKSAKENRKLAAIRLQVNREGVEKSLIKTAAANGIKLNRTLAKALAWATAG